MKKHINSYIRKGRVVSEHKREVHVITPKQRKVFKRLSNYPKEIGGQLGFKGKDLKEAQVNVGSENSMEYKYNPKYNLAYHTHPNRKGVSIMPSFDDLKSMKDGKEKGQVIFVGDYALSIVEKDKFDKAKTNDIKEMATSIEKDYNKGYTDKKLYSKYKPLLKDKLGLDIAIHKKNEPIKLVTKKSMNMGFYDEPPERGTMFRRRKWNEDYDLDPPIKEDEYDKIRKEL